MRACCLILLESQSMRNQHVANRSGKLICDPYCSLDLVHVDFRWSKQRGEESWTEQKTLRLFEKRVLHQPYPRSSAVGGSTSSFRLSGPCLVLFVSNSEAQRWSPNKFPTADHVMRDALNGKRVAFPAYSNTRATSHRTSPGLHFETGIKSYLPVYE